MRAHKALSLELAKEPAIDVAGAQGSVSFTLSFVLVVVLYHCLVASACMIVVCKAFCLSLLNK